MANKSIYLTYLFWFIGGIFGLHHLYLRRDRHAFLYWCTFGGYFGCGVLRDIYRIPSYIQDVNNDFQFLSHLSKQMRRYPKPPVSLLRFVAQLLIGHSWYYLLGAAFPGPDNESADKFAPLEYLAPFGSAIGVWVVGNIGRQEGRLKWPLIGAFSLFPFALVFPSMNNFSPLFASIAFEAKAKQWRRSPYKSHSLCRRITTLGCGWLLFSSLLISVIYFNGSIVYKDGETARLKDVIKNFVDSPMYAEFKKNTNKLFNDVFEVGWSQAWINFMELMDPLGEYHALKVLGLQRGVTQETITKTYKQLSKRWHPDRHHGEENKKEAHTKFVEIVNAYENLSTIKRRRNRRNNKSDFSQGRPV